jgi:hypothetical protein
LPAAGCSLARRRDSALADSVFEETFMRRTALYLSVAAVFTLALSMAVCAQDKPAEKPKP